MAPPVPFVQDPTATPSTDSCADSKNRFVLDVSVTEKLTVKLKGEVESEESCVIEVIVAWNSACAPPAVKQKRRVANILSAERLVVLFGSILIDTF